MFGTPSADSFWVVDSQTDADFLISEGLGGVRISLTDNKSLTEWTPGKGVGDWTEYEVLLKMSKVNLALSPWVSAGSKCKAMVEALTTAFGSLGAGVRVHQLPAGGGIKEMVAGVGIINFVAEMGRTNGQGGGLTARTTGDTFADRMYDIAYAGYNFHQSELEEPFVTSKDEQNAKIAIQFGELEKILLRGHRQDHKQVAPSSEVKNALRTIDADCTAPDIDKVALGLRCTRSKMTGNYWFDLGRKDGMMVKITKDGWEVTKNLDPDVFFKRTKSIAEMPVPTPCAESNTFAALQSYRRFANIPDAQWPLVVGWMLAHMIPGYKAPLAFFLGGAGSGKTTLSSMVIKAVEGLDDKGSDTGDNERDLKVAMASERIRYMNNISDISKDMSDLLCKVFEGVKITNRKLYSDAELVELDISCSVVANGVTVGRMREDLKTRVLALDVNPALGGTAWDGRPFGTTEELEEPMTILNEWDRAHPEVLGALFTLMSQVFRYAPSFYMQAKDYRLEEYARVLMVLDLVWQLNGSSSAEYTKLLNTLSEEALDDPLFEGVRRLSVQNANYNPAMDAWVYKVDYGTLKEYFDGNRWDRHDTTFKTTNSLRDAIIRKETDWLRLGVKVERHLVRENLPGGKKGTMVTFTFQNSGTPSFNTVPYVAPEIHRY